MDEDDVRQLALDLFQGAKDMSSEKERKHGTDARLQVIRHKAREIWGRVLGYDE